MPAYLPSTNTAPALLPVATLTTMVGAAPAAAPSNLYLVAGRLKSGTAPPANGRLIAYFPSSDGLALDPVEAAGFSSTDGATGTAPSVQVTATFSGADGAVTCAWTRADSGGTDFLIDDDASAAPTFAIASGTTAYDATQYWRCEATTATQARSAIVKVRMQRIVTGGGGSFTVSASPATSEEGGARGDTLTDSVTAIPDGVGPFSYLWTKFSGMVGITLSNATSAACNLSSSTTAGTYDIERTGILRCTCIDHGDGDAEAIVDVPLDWLWVSDA